MSKTAVYRCDRCGTTTPQTSLDFAEWGKLRMVEPDKTWEGDLCPACTNQIKSDVTFELKSKPGRKKKAVAVA